MKTKTYQAPLEFKANGQTGEFEAVFATMSVIDLDQDVTLPGAFGDQFVLIEPWNHNMDDPPVGKGVISERENEAVVSGKFFLDTPGGDIHYKVAKELAGRQEFSYTFNVLEAEPGMFDGQRVNFLKKLEVIGVGQVSKGAGIATRLTGIKKKGDGEGEVEGGPETAADDKPRGVSPQVIRVQIELAQLED